ncbi:Peroxisomal adenine nucleotide transporter 1 [Pleurostoma richardsiae]|uniref:Peroxisomal adenine nucleotide transporter 1 n=1 Tax=Pleurostoma richardsiae TaxID=41990 RepID=A0AA38RQ64_9PEZI|nr:Peroxisomal adenine nucleotide transporter 1 [Pleurostoma richardsiae]
MPATHLLPAIGHAVSGSAGTAISTLATYPLDLVNTRLKVQRQLRRDGALSAPDEYAGVLDAIRRVYAREGGLAALYVGLDSDLAKSALDSFLFFLFYMWFRARRLGSRAASGGGSSRRRLPAWEELAVGAAAGACARALTTPVGNVVTRKQTAMLVNRGGGEEAELGRMRSLSTGEIVRAIREEKGLRGLWAGYSASLVLTLNPSVTFFLQQALEKSAAPAEGGPGSGVTFLLAAVSKAVATALTYPFQVAKARVQVSLPHEKEERKVAEGGDEEEGSETSRSAGKAVADEIRSLAEDNIFATVLRIGRSEGVGALYDGVSGELLKAFFNHGITMLSKDIVHKLIVRLYFVVLEMMQRLPSARSALLRRAHHMAERVGKKPITASSNGTRAHGGI